MKRVVVTGATGSAGRSIVTVLWESGHHVVSIDIKPLDTGDIENARSTVKCFVEISGASLPEAVRACVSTISLVRSPSGNEHTLCWMSMTWARDEAGLRGSCLLFLRDIYVNGTWESLRDLSTATIGEISEGARIIEAAIRPLFTPLKILGPAYTVAIEPGDNLAVHHA